MSAPSSKQHIEQLFDRADHLMLIKHEYAKAVTYSSCITVVLL
jgi:hypothetical protein